MRTLLLVGLLGFGLSACQSGSTDGGDGDANTNSGGSDGAADGGSDGTADGGDGGADSSGVGGAGSGGTGPGASPTLTGPLADIGEALLVCTWAESCLDPEIRGLNDAFQPAPDSTMTACMDIYLTEASSGVSVLGVDPRPFDGLGACAHVASSCDDYKQCLFDIGLLNFCPDETQNGTLCDGDILRMPCDSNTEGFSRAVNCATSGMRCEAGACVGDECPGVVEECSDDGSYIDRCSIIGRQNANCHGGTCAIFEVGADIRQARCLPNSTGTCSTQGFSCEGDVLVSCLPPVESRVDCAAVGKVCENNKCENPLSAEPAKACDAFHIDTCEGTMLTVCISGSEQTLDCAEVGATCGTLSSEQPGCVVQ